MTTANENYMTMARTTNDVILVHEGLWKGSTVFTRLHNQLASLLNDTTEHQTQAEIITTGYTKDKRAAAEAAIDFAIRLAGIGISYAVRVDNKTLEDQLHISRTTFLSLSMKAIANKLEDIILQLQKVLPELKEYTVTMADIVKLTALKDRYNSLLDIPRQMTVDRKIHNEAANGLIPQIRHVFKQMDPLVATFNNPILTMAYSNSRIIIDYGTRHEHKKGTPM